MATRDLDETHLIVRRAFDTAELVASHPARFNHPHKKLVFSLACPAGAPARGNLVYSRWQTMPLPESVPAAPPVYEMREDVFGYEPGPAGAVEWYLNFADPHLFFAYAGSLLAQDELQVLEHPALGSLLEALTLSASSDPRFRPVTCDEAGATPVLVRGVERRCALATDPDFMEDRPLGLYGNRFSRAKEDAIRKALTVLTPPTISNILAMAALPGGHGAYSEGEIVATLVTAYTGFRAAAMESTLAAEGPAVVVHTGHWGTGAFGGDKVLMTMLQMLAARLAGVDRLVFHTFDNTGTEAWREGKRRLDEQLLPAGKAALTDEKLVRAIHAMKFTWGVSDGN